MSAVDPLWTPDPGTIERSNIVAAMRANGIDTYEQFHRWSVESPEAFWPYVLDRLGLRFSRPPDRILDTGDGPTKARWLPGAMLNVVESCFQADAGDPAIVTAGPNQPLRTINFGELRREADRVAHGVRAMGIGPGEPVAVFLPMTARAVAVYLGLVLAGCPVVSIADSFAADQVRIRLHIGQARAIFTVRSVLRGSKRLALYDRVVAAEGPRAILVDEQAPQTSPMREGDLTWVDFLGAEQPFKPVQADLHAPLNILFSSGTTGEPKAIAWEQAAAIKSAAEGYFHYDLHPGDIVCWPTNLGWIMGPFLIYITLINRGTIALFEGAPLDRDFGRFVEAARVNMLGVIPSIVRRWRETRCMEGLDFSSIRAFGSTGECSNPNDMRYLSALAGGRPVIEICGGTEIGGGYICSTMIQPNFPSTFSTPTLGIDFVILDEQNNPADSGELFIIPPALGLSRRLLNRDHDATYYRNTPRGPNGQVLRRHGDLMQRLPSGYYRALGRADDSMNLGGIKIGAIEIEHALAGIDHVIETAAIAVNPDDGGPSQLVICAVAESGAVVDGEHLRQVMQQRIKDRLNPLFKVHDVLLLPQLPRTATNKIIRRLLRTEYARCRERRG